MKSSPPPQTYIDQNMKEDEDVGRVELMIEYNRKLVSLT